jgi:hypothetical protein
MVPMSMAMIVWWSMMRRPRFPVLFPALPIIFQRIRSRLSLPLRPIFARRSQRRQQKPRPDGPASRRRGASSRRGRSRRSSRWGYRAVFPRRRRDTPTAMSSSSRSALPSTVLALALLLLPRIHSWRRSWGRRIARRVPPVLGRWGRVRRVLIWVW